MAVKRVKPARTPQLKIVLPHTLAASPHARYQPRVVRSLAAHAPGVRSGRSCHTPSMAQEVNLYGRAGHGRASSPRLRQPASRSGSAWSGSATRPCPARPTASRYAPWPSCVTPGQRRTPYAWSSGLLRYLACPRTYGLASSAGGKGSPQAVAQPSPHAASGSAISTATVTQQHPPATVYLSRRCATGLQRFSYRRQSCPHGAMSAGDSSRGLLSERPSFLQAEHG